MNNNGVPREEFRGGYHSNNTGGSTINFHSGKTGRPSKKSKMEARNALYNRYTSYTDKRTADGYGYTNNYQWAPNQPFLSPEEEKLFGPCYKVAQNTSQQPIINSNSFGNFQGGNGFIPSLMHLQVEDPRNTFRINDPKTISTTRNSPNSTAIRTSISLQNNEKHTTELNSASTSLAMPMLVPISQAKPSVNNTSRKVNEENQNVNANSSEVNSAGSRDKLINKILQKNVSLIKDIIENPRKATKYAPVLNSMSKDKRLSLSKQLRNTILSEEPQGNVCFMDTSTDTSIALENLPEKVSSEISELLNLSPRFFSSNTRQLERDLNEVTSNIVFSDLVNNIVTNNPEVGKPPSKSNNKSSAISSSTSSASYVKGTVRLESYVNSYKSKKRTKANLKPRTEIARPIIKCRALKDLISGDVSTTGSDVLSSNFQFDISVEKNKTSDQGHPPVSKKVKKKVKQAEKDAIKSMSKVHKKRGRPKNDTTKNCKPISLKKSKKKVNQKTLKAVPKKRIRTAQKKTVEHSTEFYIEKEGKVNQPVPNDSLVLNQPSTSNTENVNSDKIIQVADKSYTENRIAIPDKTVVSIDLDESSGDESIVCLEKEIVSILIYDSDSEIPNDSVGKESTIKASILESKDDEINCLNNNNKIGCNENNKVLDQVNILSEVNTSTFSIKESESVVENANNSFKESNSQVCASESNLIDTANKSNEDAENIFNVCTSNSSNEITDLIVAEPGTCPEPSDPQKDENVSNNRFSSTCFVRNSDESVRSKQSASNVTSEDRIVSTTYKITHHSSVIDSLNKRRFCDYAVNDSETSSTSRDSEYRKYGRSDYRTPGESRSLSHKRESRSSMHSWHSSKSNHYTSGSRSSHRDSRRYSERSSRYNRSESSRHNKSRSRSRERYHRRQSDKDKDNASSNRYRESNQVSSSRSVSHNNDSRANIICPAKFVINKNLERPKSLPPSTNSLLEKISNLEISSNKFVNVSSEQSNEYLQCNKEKETAANIDTTYKQYESIPNYSNIAEEEVVISSTLSDSSNIENVTTSRVQCSSILIEEARSHNQLNIVQLRSGNELDNTQVSSLSTTVPSESVSDNIDSQNILSETEKNDSILDLSANGEGNSTNEVNSILAVKATDKRISSDNNMEYDNNECDSDKSILTYSDVVAKMREIDMKILSLQQEKMDLYNLYFKNSNEKVLNKFPCSPFQIDNLQLLNTASLNIDKTVKRKSKHIKKSESAKKRKQDVKKVLQNTKSSLVKGNGKPKKRKMSDNEKPAKRQYTKKQKLECSESLSENKEKDKALFEEVVETNNCTVLHPPEGHTDISDVPEILSTNNNVLIPETDETNTTNKIIIQEMAGPHISLGSNSLEEEKDTVVNSKITSKNNVQMKDIDKESNTITDNTILPSDTVSLSQTESIVAVKSNSCPLNIISNSMPAVSSLGDITDRKANDNNNENTALNKKKTSADEKKKLYDGNFVGHHSPIVALYVCGKMIIAASELGVIYGYCCLTGKLVHHYSGHRSAVTCICVVDNTKLFSAALDNELRCFDLTSSANLLPPKLLAGPAQAIEYYENQLYIGTRKGQIHVYDIKTNKLEDPYSCGDYCILAIRCTREGPRRVLLVTAKEQPLSLRDAQNGLLLRHFQLPQTPPGQYLLFYSLMLSEGVVFCGTSGPQIIAFNFMSGRCTLRLQGGRGAVCLKTYKGLLFSGCYDGFIYIHNMKTGQLVHKMRGSGKMLLAIEIIDDKIISTSKDKNLVISDIPTQVMRYCNNET